MTKVVQPRNREVSRTVLVFDICSSSDILEGLKLNDNLKYCNNLLINLKEFLREVSGKYGFEIYKFIGDGWIVLFNEAEGGKVLDFLDSLSEFFDAEIKQNVLPLLDCPPGIIGITCGIEIGLLRKIIMCGKVEYVGRPINVACRLQAAVKESEKPQYKVLISRAAYKKLFLYLDLRGWSPKEVSRNLRNIRNGKDFKCINLSIPFIETEIYDKNLQ